MTERMDRMEKMMDRLVKSQKETDEQMKKTDEQMKKNSEERKKTDEQIKETGEQMKRNSEERKKNSEQSLKDTEDLKKQIKETNKQLWWMWRSQEEVWIDLFRRNMKPMMRKRGIEVDNISTRFKSAIKLEDGTMLDWEYDLMWINGKDIVVVEVKNKMRDDYITKFVNKQLPKFKTLFPQYKDYNLYGWIWWLIVWEHQEKKAEKAWLFVFTQGKDGTAVLINKPDFKAKVF